MKFISPADINSPMGLHNVMGRMAEKNELKRKQERAGQIAKAFLETAASMPEDMQGDTNALFEAVKDKIPQGATEAEIMTGLKFADYVYERQSNRKQNQRNDMLFEQGQMDRKVGEADTNLLARYMGGDDSTGGDAYSVPMTEKDYVKSMSGKGAIGLLNYKAGNEAAKQKALIDAEKRKEDSDYKQALIAKLKSESEGKKYSKQELAMKRLEYVNEATKGMGEILEPDKYQAARKAAGDEFDSAMGIGAPKPAPGPAAPPPEKATSILDRIFGSGKPNPEPAPTKKTTQVQPAETTQSEGFLNRPFEESILGKTESAIKNLPKNIRLANEVSGQNRDAIERQVKPESGIPSIGGVKPGVKMMIERITGTKIKDGKAEVPGIETVDDAVKILKDLEERIGMKIEEGKANYNPKTKQLTIIL